MLHGIVIDDVDVKVVNRLLRERAEKRKNKTYCQCGCGVEIPALTMNGRPRRFALGHHKKMTAAGRTEKVSVFFTPTERAEIKATAKAVGCSLMGYIRLAVEEKRRRDGK